MDPLYNCAMLICCPPEALTVSDKSLKATADLLVKYGGLSEALAKEAAPAIHKTFDLAPKGSLQPFIQMIVALSKQP